MNTPNKLDWHYAFIEKLKAKKLRRMMAERGVIIDGPIESQIEQLISAGIPSWSLYNLTRRYLLGSVSTSVTFGYLVYAGDYARLVTDLRTYMDAVPREESVGPYLTRVVQQGAGPSTHIVADFIYRVDRLGSDLSLTRDQKIANYFKIKRIEEGGYVFWCYPKTRYDAKQVVSLISDATENTDRNSEVLFYAPCPTTRVDSKHFLDGEQNNSFFMGLFSNGFMGFSCEDVFKADTFEWTNGFEFTPRVGDEVVRDRAEVIRRIRLEGIQLNLDTGRVNEIVGQGYAIHNFGATFLYNNTEQNGYSWQVPLEFKFASRPFLISSIIGGPLLYRRGDIEWSQYPDISVTESILLHAVEKLLCKIHDTETIRLPGSLQRLTDIPII